MYYYITECDWQTEQTVSNDFLKTAPHQVFFLEDVPEQFSKTPDYLARREVELELEKFRSKNHPHMPSRKKVIFLNTNVDDAREWLQKAARKGKRLYELEPIQTEAAHQANIIWYNYLIRLKKSPDTENQKLFSANAMDEANNCMHRYWHNTPTEEYGEPSKTELLYIGQLRVVRQIYDRNSEESEQEQRPATQKTGIWAKVWARVIQMFVR